MSPSSVEAAAAATPHPLEAVIDRVEQGLVGLQAALRERDAPAIEMQAQALYRALADAVEQYMHCARHGGVPEPLRVRFARASAQLARQRDMLSRATAALDRAIDVLIPQPADRPALYGPAGGARSLRSTGSVEA